MEVVFNLNKISTCLICFIILISCNLIPLDPSAEVNSSASDIANQEQTPFAQENFTNVDGHPNSDEILDIGHFAQKILYLNGQVWVLKSGGDLIKIRSVDPHEQEYFSVPSHARDIIFDGQYIWILIAQPGENGMIVRFDPDKVQISGQFQVGTSPISVTYGKGFLWISDFADKKIRTYAIS